MIIENIMDLTAEMLRQDVKQKQDIDIEATLNAIVYAHSCGYCYLRSEIKFSEYQKGVLKGKGFKLLTPNEQQKKEGDTYIIQW